MVHSFIQKIQDTASDAAKFNRLGEFEVNLQINRDGEAGHIYESTRGTKSEVLKAAKTYLKQISAAVLAGEVSVVYMSAYKYDQHRDQSTIANYKLIISL